MSWLTFTCAAWGACAALCSRSVHPIDVLQSGVRPGAVATLLAAVCLVIAGCGDRLETYPVSGQVHFTDGKPLPGGIVVFVSKESGVQARARIQEDGSFELGTLAKDDGSVGGVHRVAVQPLVLGPGMAPEHPVARKYHSVTTSGIEFTVRTDGPNEFEIVVEPPDAQRIKRDSADLPEM